MRIINIYLAQRKWNERPDSRSRLCINNDLPGEANEWKRKEMEGTTYTRKHEKGETESLGNIFSVMIYFSVLFPFFSCSFDHFRSILFQMLLYLVAKLLRKMQTSYDDTYTLCKREVRTLNRRYLPSMWFLLASSDARNDWCRRF